MWSFSEAEVQISNHHMVSKYTEYLLSQSFLILTCEVQLCAKGCTEIPLHIVHDLKSWLLLIEGQITIAVAWKLWEEKGSVSRDTKVNVHATQDVKTQGFPQGGDSALRLYFERKRKRACLEYIIRTEVINKGQTIRIRPARNSVYTSVFLMFLNVLQICEK